MRRPLLISHDLSYSGAPVALLALAKALQRLGENPVVAPLAGGPLGAKFLESGIAVATKIDPAGVSFVIANTILSIPTALRFKRAGTPIAAWIHESTHFFRILNLAPEQCRLQELDVVLAPSKSQLVEFEPLLRPGSAYQLRNVVRQNSFRAPGDESIVTVCGGWEARKGQAELLELVRRSATKCRFKFIGARRPPGHDAAGAFPSPHMFLGAIDPDEAKMEIARSAALVSCAAAETQNLCAIEALMAGRPVLLSDIEAHRTLARLVPNVFLFDRTSPESFAEGYTKWGARCPTKRAAAGQARQRRRCSARRRSIDASRTSGKCSEGTSARPPASNATRTYDACRVPELSFSARATNQTRSRYCAAASRPAATQ